MRPERLTFPTSCPNQLSGSANSPISYADGTTVLGPYAPKGTRLPGVPRLKTNLIGRYNFSIASDWTAHAQASRRLPGCLGAAPVPGFYQHGPAGQQHLGELPPYTLLNLAFGVDRNGTQMEVRLDNAINTLGELTRFAACTPTSCNQPYVIPVQPRTVWLQFGQRF